MKRHKRPGGERHARDHAELHDLIEGEGPSAQLLGHKFRDVGIDRHQFHADADSGNDAPR